MSVRDESSGYLNKSKWHQMNRRAVASYVHSWDGTLSSALLQHGTSFCSFSLTPFCNYFLFFSKQQWTVLKRPGQLVTRTLWYIEYSDVSPTTGTFMKSMLDVRPVMCEENNSDKYYFGLEQGFQSGVHEPLVVREGIAGGSWVGTRYA